MINLKESQYYINRELSWLQFNTRVLKQAQRTTLPLLERLKFLAIYGTNLDEFYMIRVAGLKKLFEAGVVVVGADRLTPLQQLRHIRSYLHQELQVVEHTLDEILKELEKEGVTIKHYNQVSNKDKSFLNKFFYEQIYPVIVPIAIDATHPFPHLNNLSFGLVVQLQDTDDESVQHYGLVRIPRILPRYVELSSSTYVPIGSVVVQHIEELFPGYSLIRYTPFRVTRNADMTIEEEEADDFLEMLEEGLRLRKKGELVRLEIGINADDDLIDFFNRHTNIYKDDIYRFRTTLNLGSLWQIVNNKDLARLQVEQHKPRTLLPLTTSTQIYPTLDKQDILMFHPYESFEPIVKLTKDASIDPAVVSIRMTLYRSGKDSPIVKALIHAAESGKQVTVMVELKARFDEENNLLWAKSLESAGAHVIYGIPGFKVHAKALLITKKSDGKLKQYAHLGTGNYSPLNAKIYTDASLLTSDTKITQDLTRFFNFLSGFSKKGKLAHLYMSPAQIKPKILSLISQEAAKGSKGHIIAKMNALIDEDVIRALYRASSSGVKIELIVRGMCALKPGLEGVSENIKVISIVGKYLEHARVFYFKNSNPNIYISSADWMTRNLIRRIELLTPINDESASDKLLEILKLQLADDTLAYELQSDGNYIKAATNSEINSQELLENHVKKIYRSQKSKTPSYAQKLTKRLQRNDTQLSKQNPTDRSK